MKHKKVIVAGDICIDWIIHTYSELNPREPKNAIANWQNAKNTQMMALSGGALLLNEMVQAAIGHETISHDVGEIKNITEEQVPHSYARVVAYEEGHNAKFHRINEFLGYTGPVDTSKERFKLAKDLTDPDLLILADSGNGFRDTKDDWKALLEGIGKNTRILYKMSWPLFQGPLFDEVMKRYRSQVTLVITADDLREEGVNISKRLSWDKTIIDFAQKIYGTDRYLEEWGCPDIIVRFGMEGAVHYYDDDSNPKSVKKKAELYYYPGLCEGEIIEKTNGSMQGISSAFVAAIAKALNNPGDRNSISESLGGSIPAALSASRLLIQYGYDYKDGEMQIPYSKIFHSKIDTDVRKITLPLHELKSSEPVDWSILYEETQMEPDLAVAMQYVTEGTSRYLRNVPIVRFSKLVLIDRNEIEKFRTVSNQIKEYYSNSNDKPLSLGIFGPPGSGKSFGVKQVIKDIYKDKPSTLEFNLSQFQSLNELIRAFHKIRDYTLRDEIPIVFFDEFDSMFENKPLGWLKYFLAPMQDGEFRDGDNIHPIGKVIFVFAGATCSTFQEFSREIDANKEEIEFFRDIKGPDFTSRLKGYVNITGINQTSIFDRLHVIRRAIVLRSLLKNYNIVDDHDKIHLDTDVLKALLTIPAYKHGSRSMAALLEMSKLNQRTRFDKSALPPVRQLDLHVNGDVFMKVVDQDLFFAKNLEKLAIQIHNHYLENQKKKEKPKPDDHVSMQGWEALNDGAKNSNRFQALDLFTKLLQVKCFYQKDTEPDKPEASFSFDDPDVVELLAEMEHKRWNSEKVRAKWQPGNDRDDNNRIHDSLVPWRDLDNKTKDYDRDAIRAIPAVLKGVGYEVVAFE